MTQELTRGPGRPKQNLPSQATVKKGKSSWAPASVLEVVDKEPGYRYRWSHKAPDNLSKKAQEGWETVSAITSDRSKHVDSGRIEDGKPMTSIYEKHDCVLQRIPEELAQQRDEFFNGRTRRQTQGLTAHIKKDIRDKGGNAPVHGNITISSRMGEQVID